MRAGRLDRRVTIQRKTETPSASGQPIESWANLSARRWASYSPLGGDERFADPQYAGKQQVEWGIRWSADVAGLRPLDRIVYPALEGSPLPEPDHSAIFDIVAVHEIGRREGLRVVTVRRADT
jgi:head-tail adaptor